MMQDIVELLEGLRRTPKILSAFVHSIPAEKRDLCRGEGFWTVSEHVSHLAQVQPMLLNRFQRFMDEEQPEFVPYLPGQGEEEAETPPLMEINTALEQFVHYRQRELLLLDQADEATWQKRAIHPEYEVYSLYIMTRHVLMHDYWHMYRMEELWLTGDAFLTRLD